MRLARPTSATAAGSWPALARAATVTSVSSIPRGSASAVRSSSTPKKAGSDSRPAACWASFSIAIADGRCSLPPTVAWLTGRPYNPASRAKRSTCESWLNTNTCAAGCRACNEDKNMPVLARLDCSSIADTYVTSTAAEDPKGDEPGARWVWWMLVDILGGYSSPTPFTKRLSPSAMLSCCPPPCADDDTMRATDHIPIKAAHAYMLHRIPSQNVEGFDESTCRFGMETGNQATSPVPFAAHTIRTTQKRILSDGASEPELHENSATAVNRTVRRTQRTRREGSSHPLKNFTTLLELVWNVPSGEKNQWPKYPLGCGTCGDPMIALVQNQAASRAVPTMTNVCNQSCCQALRAQSLAKHLLLLIPRRFRPRHRRKSRNP